MLFKNYWKQRVMNIIKKEVKHLEILETYYENRMDNVHLTSVDRDYAGKEWADALSRKYTLLTIIERINNNL